MNSGKTYYVQRKVLDNGLWYLKRGDIVPAEVPAEVVELWLKAKHISEAKPAATKSEK